MSIGWLLLLSSVIEILYHSYWYYISPPSNWQGQHSRSLRRNTQSGVAAPTTNTILPNFFSFLRPQYLAVQRPTIKRSFLFLLSPRH